MEADLAASEQFYRLSLISYYLYETEYLFAVGSQKISGGF
jgi:hypothetical protein